MGSILLSELKPVHIEQLHSNIAVGNIPKIGMTRGGTVIANRCLSDIKAALNKAIQWEIISNNPANKIKKIKEQPRKRFLDEAELQRLFQTMHSLEENHTWAYKYKECIDAVKLALFTGCRKGELLSTKWQNIDLESLPPKWTKPHETTKQDEWEVVPLSEECVNVLKDRKTRNEQRSNPSPYVFPEPGNPDNHMMELKHSWTTLRKKANLQNFTFHDLRHTFASHMAIQGKSLYVIGKMLGHKNAQTTQRYAKLNTGALEDLANSMSAVVQAAVQVPVPANDNNSVQKQERESA